MATGRAFDRNPIFFILLGVVMATQLAQGFSSLARGDVGYATTSFVLGALGIVVALLLSRVPVARIEAGRILVYRVPVRPDTVPRDSIARLERHGQKAYLALHDGRRLEVPLSWARPDDRDEIVRAIEAWLREDAGPQPPAAP